MGLRFLKWSFFAFLSFNLHAALINRQEWAQMPPRFEEMELDEVKTLTTLHHTVHTQDDEILAMQAILYLHQEIYGWADIGYHFVVAPSGNIYEGRDLEYLGAHTLDKNKGNIGIAFMGCYDDVGCPKEGHPVTQVTEELLDSTARLLAYLSVEYQMSFDVGSVLGRSEWVTETSFPYSPGNKILEKRREILKRMEKILENSETIYL